MKVFVTGHRGYIGAHLIRLLKEEGHRVTGCDIRLFDGCNWEEPTRPDLEIARDIRHLESKDLEGYDCVMHLAAISNDPMGEIDPEVTRSINRDGSIHLAEISRKGGIGRFLFASSCSIYGRGEGRELDETDQLNPASAYALSKIEAEKEIGRLADDNFSPTFLRFSTAYGHSPMLRIDLVVNNLLACAYTRGDIRIKSDGTPWRPLIHVEDISRAFLAFMKMPKRKIHNIAVNIGSNEENYQVIDIAEEIKRLIPDAKIVFTGEIGHDPRNYRVRFNLLKELIPHFRLRYTLGTGMEELYKKFREHKFSLQDFEGERYIRLKMLKKNWSLLNS